MNNDLIINYHYYNSILILRHEDFLIKSLAKFIGFYSKNIHIIDNPDTVKVIFNYDQCNEFAIQFNSNKIIYEINNYNLNLKIVYTKNLTPINIHMQIANKKMDINNRPTYDIYDLCYDDKKILKMQYEKTINNTNIHYSFRNGIWYVYISKYGFNEFKCVTDGVIYRIYKCVSEFGFHYEYKLWLEKTDFT